MHISQNKKFELIGQALPNTLSSYFHISIITDDDDPRCASALCCITVGVQGKDKWAYDACHHEALESTCPTSRSYMELEIEISSGRVFPPTHTFLGAAMYTPYPKTVSVASSRNVERTRTVIG